MKIVKLQRNFFDVDFIINLQIQCYLRKTFFIRTFFTLIIDNKCHCIFVTTL